MICEYLLPFEMLQDKLGQRITVNIKSNPFLSHSNCLFVVVVFFF